MVRGPNGPEGFGMDMIEEVAKRIGRPAPQVLDVNFSGLFAALFAKRIEFTVNPLNITAERAERMLYTEPPFFATGNGFIVRQSDTMTGFDDLKGKALAVNRGTISDTWATDNAAKYGFEVQRYDTFPDSVQAVLTRRALYRAQRDSHDGLRGQQEQGDQGRLQGLQRPQLRLCVPARRCGLPQQSGGGDRMHEAGRHARTPV